MYRFLAILLFFLLVAGSSAKSEEVEEDAGIFSSVKYIVQTYLIDPPPFVRLLTDYVLNPFMPAKAFVDVGKALVSSTTSVKDLSRVEEEMYGFAFDKFEEKNANYLQKGIDLDKFEFVIKTIAESHSIRNSLVQQILLGVHSDSNAIQTQEFEFNAGGSSNVWYCKITTAKSADKKIDFAMAFYKLDFKISDEIKKHSKQWTLLGIPFGTEEWTTREPRKLSMADQSLFIEFLRAKAVNGFIAEHPYLAITDKSDRDDL